VAARPTWRSTICSLHARVPGLGTMSLTWHSSPRGCRSFTMSSSHNCERDLPSLQGGGSLLYRVACLPRTGMRLTTMPTPLLHNNTPLR
jgi:hypothetical protein